MSPLDFVTKLKQKVRESSSAELDYVANPPVANPPAHLGEFCRWYRGLSEEQKLVAADLMRYVAEGTLFELLTLLDNVACLNGGSLEIYHIDGESRTLLNDPEGDLLYDLFNQVA